MLRGLPNADRPDTLLSLRVLKTTGAGRYFEALITLDSFLHARASEFSEAF